MTLSRQLWLYFWRDVMIAKTYRSPFIFDIIQALFGAATFFYASRFVDSPQLRSALPQPGSYFAFALVGFVFYDYLSVAMDTFDASLMEARDSGTLEHLLVTQTSLPALLAGSAIYPFVITTLRIAIYIAWGAILFHFPLAQANWIGVVLVLAASLLAFSGLGIFSAAYLLLFKKGNPAKWLLVGLWGIAGGMLFPVAILPDWLQVVARLNPMTHALNAMRAALLGGAGLPQLLPSIGILLLFAVVLLPLSMLTFSWTLSRTKVTGTLSHR
ncbi:MAG TPA: ABC transporter permease [Dongiaceae bacterium]|nr:ABC transporter permease [Dongiaceae bacterium]